MKTSHSPSSLRSVLLDPFRDFGEFGTLETRLERLLGRPWSRLLHGPSDKEAMTVAHWAPAVDISEDDKEYVVKAELPDLKKEEVKVSVENGELTISGERKFEKEETGRKYHRIERSYGTFLRSFTLPDSVDATKARADFKNGMLEVHLPKDVTSKPKSIEINVQ